MTVTYGFYDSLSGDRRYNAAQFSKMFDAIVNDGVFGSIGTAFQVLAGTGLNVEVGEGRAWFDHSWTYNDAVLTLAIATAHAVLDRIDTVVIETNSSSEVRANSIKVITGTPGSTPVPPTLTHTSTVNQYPFAHVLVPHSSTQILQGNITNKIGTSDCPLVTGILQVMDIDVMVSQWEAEFDLWFQNLINQLTENQAANLQAQINEHNHSEPLNTKVVEGGIADAAVTLLKLSANLRFQKLFEFAGDGVSHFDWNNIPQNFTHLLMIFSGISTRTSASSDGISALINGDSGTNYHSASYQIITGVPHWNWGITNPNNDGMYCGLLPSENVGALDPSSGIVLFPNYKGATLYKTSLAYSFSMGIYSHELMLISSKWLNAAPITRLTGYMTPPYYPRTGSLFTLYGFN